MIVGTKLFDSETSPHKNTSDKKVKVSDVSLAQMVGVCNEIGSILK